MNNVKSPRTEIVFTKGKKQNPSHPNFVITSLTVRYFVFFYHLRLFTYSLRFSFFYWFIILHVTGIQHHSWMLLKTKNVYCFLRIFVCIGFSCKGSLTSRWSLVVTRPSPSHYPALRSLDSCGWCCSPVATRRLCQEPLASPVLTSTTTRPSLRGSRTGLVVS